MRPRALQAASSAGLIEFRIANPSPAAKPWANPMVFELYLAEESTPAAERVYNRLSLDDRGVLTWNGSPIDLITLRQYGDLTLTMDPIPWLALDPSDQASWREVGPILGILWRAQVQNIELSTPDSRRGYRSTGLRLNAKSLVR